MPEAPPVDDVSINAAIEADLAGMEDTASPEGADQAEVPAEVNDTPAGDSPPTYTLSDGTEVPLEELEKGFLRQSDYTRKTQALAEQRQQMEHLIALAQALEDDPAGTLEALRANLVGDEDTEDIDPVAAKLRDHDQFIQAQQDAQFERELQTDLDQIASRFGEFDRESVLQHAIDNNIPNLRAAYLDYTDSLTIAEQRAEANATALAAKRNAPPIAGRSRAAGSDRVPLVEVKSLNDALANALAEHPEIDW